MSAAFDDDRRLLLVRGFSADDNCPSPPRQRCFQAVIEAGERFPVFRGGCAVH
jgi:hypothetical protein